MMKKNFFNKSTIAVIALTAGLILILSGCSGKGSADKNASGKGNNASTGAMELKEGENLTIPVSEISTTAKFYSVKVGGTTMEIIAVKAPDGSIRTAFNTCQVCYSSGRGYYKQSGGKLVCQNCGNQFGMDQVEIKSGGCNPWPIFDPNKTVTDDSITISYNFLKASKQVFANWKTSY